MKNLVLTTEKLSLGYKAGHQSKIVLNGINASLTAGEFVCLIGPNGVGKSTLLRTLAALQPALDGSVLLNMGDDVWRNIHLLKEIERAKRLSVVLTDRIDVANLTSYGLTALGRYPHTDWIGRLSHRDDEVIRWALQSVGADDLSNRQVHELSDGERQKVMIARSLAQEPVLIILDEPTAYLDLPRRVEIMRTLRQLAHNTGRAILLSSHDLDLALRSADVLWMLSPKGTLHIGAPEDLVLNGVFESIFCQENLEFDKLSGTFQLQQKNGAYAELFGQGIQAIWTERALERGGFHVIRNHKSIHTPGVRISIEEDDRKLTWVVSDGLQNHSYTSIYDLMGFLRQHRDKMEIK